MSVLTVRNLDEATRDRLKARAAENGRSMEGEARVILTAAVALPDESAAGLGTRIGQLFADLDWPGTERSEELARSASFSE